jgi:hypothetical protein
MTDIDIGIKARYRNKLKKVIIEVWNGQKWLYVKTLNDPLVDFKTECLAKVSLNAPVNEEKKPQKFGQYLLDAPLKQDTNKKKSTEEELKMLWELAK